MSDYIVNCESYFQRFMEEKWGRAVSLDDFKKVCAKYGKYGDNAVLLFLGETVSLKAATATFKEFFEVQEKLATAQAKANELKQTNQETREALAKEKVHSQETKCKLVEERAQLEVAQSQVEFLQQELTEAKSKLAIAESETTTLKKKANTWETLARKHAKCERDHTYGKGLAYTDSSDDEEESFPVSQVAKRPRRGTENTINDEDRATSSSPISSESVILGTEFERATSSRDRVVLRPLNKEDMESQLII